MSGSCIIVGVGAAGASAASVLKGSGIDVTIVDKQNYHDWSMASARSLVNPDEVEKQSFVLPLDRMAEFFGAKFVQSAVKEIGPKSVTLVNGEILEADCIIAAIGGHYASGAFWKPTPELTTKEKRIASFRAENKKLALANSVVVAGAGFTGAEVAGEIKAAFPEKKVTLVGTFLANASENSRRGVKSALQTMGVILIPEGRVEQDEPIEGKVTTTKGETIDADIIYNCAGFIYSGKNLLEESLQTDVTDRGQISCRSNLQLDNCDTIFACGDILKIPEGKYGDIRGWIHAEATAKLAAANVIAFISGEEKLSDFAWSDEAMSTPAITILSPDVGVGDLGLPACMNGIQNFLARKLKGQDFFVGKLSSDFGKGETW